MEEHKLYKPGFKVKPLSAKKINDVVNMFVKNNLPAKVRRKYLLDMEYIFEFVLQKIGYTRMLVNKSVLPPNVEAQCDFTNKIIKIAKESYEAEIWTPRFRFTLAHELAHAILHTSQFDGMDYTAARTINVMQDCKIYESSEWQADTAASYLLMPEEKVRKILEKGMQRNSSMKYLISIFCRRFGVSKTAAELRIKKELLMKATP